MVRFLTLGVHKLREHSIPFKRKMKHQCKITLTNLQDYNKKSTIIVALFLRYHRFKLISHSYSMGPRIHTIKPATLFAEVLAFEIQNHDKNETEYTVKGRYDRFYRPHNHSHNRPHPYSKPINYNPSEFCTFCKRRGHSIDSCLEKQWRDTQAKEDEQESEKESENKLIPYDWKSASTTKMNWSNTKQT